MATESGYNNQKKFGKSEFKTINSVGSDKFGAPVIQKSLFQLPAYAAPVAIVSVAQGTTEDDKHLLYIEMTGHGARTNDVLRLSTGALASWEFDIVEIVDADIFAVYNIGEVDGVETLPQAGDTAKIMRWVTPKADQEGNLNFSPGPTIFIKDGINVTVTEDTAVPANNIPLPTKTFFQYNGIDVPVVQDDAVAANNRPAPNLIFFEKDGVIIKVAKDTGTPANTAAIPVEIVSASGTEINITAGDIDIHTTDLGVNFDAIRVGDGSGNYIAVNANDEALVHDQDVLDELVTLNLVDFATEAKQDAQIVELQDIETELVTLNAEVADLNTKFNTLGQKAMAGSVPVVIASDQSTLPVSAASLPLPTGAATEVTLSDLNTKFNTLGQKTMAASAPVVIASDQSTLPISAASLPLPTGAATEATSAAISGKLPATLGQKTGANSLAVVPASDYTPPSPAVPAALTTKNATVTAGVAAIRATTDNAAPSATRRKLIIFMDPDTFTGKLYLGNSAVTISGANKGVQIFPGVPFILDNDANDYYIISDTASNPVAILEVE